MPLIDTINETEEERRRRLAAEATQTPATPGTTTAPPSTSTTGWHLPTGDYNPVPFDWNTDASWQAMGLTHLDWSGYYDLYKDRFETAGVSREQAIGLGNIYGRSPYDYGLPWGWSGPTEELLNFKYQEYPDDIKQLIYDTFYRGFDMVGGQPTPASGYIPQVGTTPGGGTGGGTTGGGGGTDTTLPDTPTSGTSQDTGGLADLARQWAIARGVPPNAEYLWNLEGKAETEQTLNDIIAYLKKIDATAVGDSGGYTPGQIAPPGMPDEIAASLGLIPRSEAEQYTKELASITPPGWKWVTEDGVRKLKSPDGETHLLEEVANDPVWGNYIRAGLGTSISTESGWKMVELGLWEDPEGNQFTSLQLVNMMNEFEAAETDEEKQAIADKYYKPIEEQNFWDGVKEVLGTVFPDENINALYASLRFDEGKTLFVSEMQKQGRTEKTEALINFMFPNMPEAEKFYLFNEPYVSMEQWAKNENKYKLPWEKTVTADTKDTAMVEKYEAYLDKINNLPDWFRSLSVGMASFLDTFIAHPLNWLNAKLNEPEGETGEQYALETVADFFTDATAQVYAIKVIDTDPEKFDWKDISTGLIENAPTMVGLAIATIATWGAASGITAGIATSLLTKAGLSPFWKIALPKMFGGAKTISIPEIAGLTVGSQVASTIEASMEAASVYDQALDIYDGDAIKALEAADETWWQNMGVLGITNFAEFAVAFMPMGKAASKTLPGMTVADAAVKRGFLTITKDMTKLGGRITAVMLTETGQEVAQEYISRTALGQTFELDDEMRLTVYIAMIYGGGFASAGAIYTEFLSGVKDNLPTDLQDEIDTAIEGKTGDELNVALTEAFNQMVASNSAEVETAIELFTEGKQLDTAERIANGENIFVTSTTKPVVDSETAQGLTQTPSTLMTPTEIETQKAYLQALKSTPEQDRLATLMEKGVDNFTTTDKAEWNDLVLKTREQYAQYKELEAAVPTYDELQQRRASVPSTPTEQQIPKPTPKQIANKALISKRRAIHEKNKEAAGIETKVETPNAEVKIVRADEKSATYAYGKTKGAFRYDQYVQWPDGEKTLITKETLGGETVLRTQGRYDIDEMGQKADIAASNAASLKEKVQKRWLEMQKEFSSKEQGKEPSIKETTKEKPTTKEENKSVPKSLGAAGMSLIPFGADPKARVIEIATEQVKQDRPGLITKWVRAVPGLKQLAEFERPGLKMEGESENILVAHVAARAAKSDVLAKTNMSEQYQIRNLAKHFGKDSLTGGKANVKFKGTADTSVLTGTLKDIADNPDLYELSRDQIGALADFENRNRLLVDYVVEGYGVELGKWEPKLTGAYLPNVDISEDAVEMAGSESRNIARGRGKTRVWPTMRDRMAHDKSVVPELNVLKLIGAIDSWKASAASAMTFRDVLNGKTKLEVLQETHPNLYAKMMALRKELASLKGSKQRLEEKAVEAIEEFELSSFETEDIDKLVSGLTLETGKRKGAGIPDIEAQMDAVMSQIKELRPAWDAANPKPYVFIQNGIFRYFKVEQANLIKELLKTTNDKFLNLMEMIRGTAFSGDLSPILGVQTPLGALFDPLGALRGLSGAFKRAMQEGDILRSFRMDKFLDDISDNPTEWGEFFALTGRPPSGTPSEFAGGFLAKIPGFSAFTESTFLMVTRQQFLMWQRLTDSMVKSGATELTAKVAAAEKVSEVFPLLNEARLGQSQERYAQLRALPTSYSFIRQPMRMLSDAATALGKVVMRKPLAPKEQLAIRLMLTLSTSIMFISVMSAVLDALRRKDDPLKAAWDAINPDPFNGKFASIIINEHLRIPIGGPYRALFRAIWPQEVTGVPVPVPFAGIYQFFKNRTNPVISTTWDLIQNEDYFHRPIRTGDTQLEQFLRGLEYALESVMPLSIGQVVEDIRTGETDNILRDFMSQFAGFNLQEMGKTEATEDLLSKLGVEQPAEDGDDFSFKSDRIYNTNDLWTDLNSKMKYVKPGDITTVKGYDPIVVSWNTTKPIDTKVSLMPSTPLKSIASGDLLKYKTDGKINQAEYALLVQYNSLYTQKDKDAFLKAHPELNVDPRDTYLKANPDDNALLAIWGKEKLTSVEALEAAIKLSTELGIPASAMNYVPPQDAVKGYTAYLKAQSEYKGVTFGSTTEAEKIRIANPALDAWGCVYLGWSKPKTAEAQKIYEELKGEPYIPSVASSYNAPLEITSQALPPPPNPSVARPPEEFGPPGDLMRDEPPTVEEAFQSYKEIYKVPDTEFFKSFKLGVNPDVKGAAWATADAIEITPDSLKKNRGWVAEVMAHETAHQAWFTLSKSEQDNFWRALNQAEAKPIRDFIQQKYDEGWREYYTNAGVKDHNSAARDEAYAILYANFPDLLPLYDVNAKHIAGFYRKWAGNDFFDEYISTGLQAAEPTLSRISGGPARYSPEVENYLEDMNGDIKDDPVRADIWLKKIGFTPKQSQQFLGLYKQGKISGQGNEILDLQETIEDVYLKWTIDGFTFEEILKEYGI